MSGIFSNCCTSGRCVHQDWHTDKMKHMRGEGAWWRPRHSDKELSSCIQYINTILHVINEELNMKYARQTGKPNYFTQVIDKQLSCHHCCRNYHHENGLHCHYYHCCCCHCHDSYLCRWHPPVTFYRCNLDASPTCHAHSLCNWSYDQPSKASLHRANRSILIYHKTAETCTFRGENKL